MLGCVLGPVGALGRLRVPVLAAAVAVGLLSTASPAQAGQQVGAAPRRPPAALQAALDRVVADGVPGALAFERRGGQVWLATSGVRDIGTGAPMRAEDRFRIGSITKSFVSTVVLQLAGQRRLRLADSIQHWLPGLVPGGDRITVRELLNHTSGIFNYTTDPRVLAPYLQQRDWDYYWSPRRLVAIAVSHPPLFPPGSSWSYSNTNYILLGLIVQAVTGHDPVAAVHERLIEPLHLTDTSFPVRDPHLSGPHTHGYLTNLPPTLSPAGVVDVTTFSPSPAWTAGGIVSTVEDVARFHRALVTGQLLRPAQQRELMTTVAAGGGIAYGLGLFETATRCGPAWGHDGDFPGYASVSLTSPDGTRQAVLAINSDQILSAQAQQDYAATLDTAFCGRPAASEQEARSGRPPGTGPSGS